MKIISRFLNSLRWRLGLPVANPVLESGADSNISKFYNDRITFCEFVTDPEHYEYPRFEWLKKEIKGNNLLEIGCGDGGMTAFFSDRFTHVTAMDVSKVSLEKLNKKKLPNVVTVESLIETYNPDGHFDCIVVSEVIEHLRDPESAVKLAYSWLSPGGIMLITTPNGYWESDEHLHEFSFFNFLKVLNSANAEGIRAEYVRDRSDKRRWLAGVVLKPLSIAEPDDFFSRKARLRKR